MTCPFKLVLLDRDGVINKDLSNSVRSLNEFEILDGVPQAIALLNKNRIKVAIVTNQAVVGRGELAMEGLEEIHEYLQSELAKHGAHVDAIYVCTDKDPSPRRKPEPGMLLEAIAYFQVPPSETLMIGDAMRDLQAAHKAGCPTILVETGKGLQTCTHPELESCAPAYTFPDLPTVVDFILNGKI